MPDISAFDSRLKAVPPRPMADRLAEVRAQFPIAARRSYLNNASIGPMSTPVIAAINEFLGDVRDHGRNNYPEWCRRADTEFKKRIGTLIGASADEIAFAKNTTEGLGFVANGLDWREGDNVVLPNIEYASNVYPWLHLARRGVEISWVRPRQGRIDIEDIKAAITPRTRLVSVSAVQFSNGFRQDLGELSALCRSRGVLLNIDGIQWVGAMHMDVVAADIDFLSVGGHKWMLGPIGTGFFYCNKNALDQLTPPTVGYHTVDKHEAHMDYDLTYRPNAGRFEEALVNFPGIWGLDAAIRMHLEVGTRNIEAHILGLIAGAIAALETRGWTIDSPQGPGQSSGLLSFSAPGIDLESMVERLTDAGVDLALRGGVLRISPSFYNNAEDIERCLEALPKL